MKPPGKRSLHNPCENAVRRPLVAPFTGKGNTTPHAQLTVTWLRRLFAGYDFPNASEITACHGLAE